jgi:hypothetical protein
MPRELINVAIAYLVRASVHEQRVTVSHAAHHFNQLVLWQSLHILKVSYHLVAVAAV